MKIKIKFTNMDKICTSIEQSKKLIKLGIDVSTANMHYQWYSETESALHVGKGSKKLNADCPAWSLSALLKYLQKFRAQGYIPILFPTENKWILNFVECGHGTICKVACYDPVDACVEMILTIVPILKLRGVNIL